MVEKNYDYLFKVLLTGEEKVGKTAILNRYIPGVFYENYNSTIDNKKLFI